MTYPQLALGLVAFAVVVRLVATVAARRAGRRIPLVPTLVAAVALVALTAVFDNVMLAAGVDDYSRLHASGLAIGRAPVEDFSYPLAAAVLLTPSRKIIDGVQAELTRQLKTRPRREIAGRSLEDHGALVLTASLNEALELANSLAPEHLELAVAEPFSWLDKVENAGTVFLGHFTPEPLGDYLAGSNHILPTLGSARFSSPLGTLDFLKRTAVVYYGAEASAEDAGRVAAFARAEGLEAHARSAEARKEERP